MDPNERPHPPCAAGLRRAVVTLVTAWGNTSSISAHSVAPYSGATHPLEETMKTDAPIRIREQLESRVTPLVVIAIIAVLIALLLPA